MYGCDVPKRKCLTFRSREDFRRSIDQWYNLAEMQLARGQVDLSIEANAQVLYVVNKMPGFVIIGCMEKYMVGHLDA